MVPIDEFEIIFYKNNQPTIHECLKNKIKDKNQLSFDILECDTTIDLEDKYFKRENEEYIFFLDIQNKTCTITLKKENINFSIQVELCEFIETEKEIILEYLIKTDDAKNKIIIHKKGTK